MIQIMKIKKYIFPISILAIFLVYIFRLTDFPIFADEAIYLHWARRIFLGDENIFISLYDGKPPLFMWLSALGSFIYEKPLLIGRLISVLALLGNLVLIFRFLKKDKKVSWAWLSLLLITTCPLIFFHTRLALLDSLFVNLLLAGIFAWTFVKTKWRGLLTGILLGLAFWTKTPELFLIPFPIASAVLFERSQKSLKQAFVATIVNLGLIAFFKVSVWFPSLFGRSQDFTFSISQILAGQTDQIWPNLKRMCEWLVAYEMLPVLILALIGILLGFKKGNKLIKNLVLASLFFAAPFVILGKVLAPRYYLFLGLTLPLLAAYLISLMPKKVKLLPIILILIFSLPFNFLVLKNYKNVPLPQLDKDQYLRDWSSGIGIKEASEFFLQQSQKGKVKVLSEGYFGTLPDGLFVIMGKDLNGAQLEIIGVGDNNSPNYLKEKQKAEVDFLYYIGNQNRVNVVTTSDLKLLKSYEKVEDGFPLQIFEVNKSLTN
jgi:4-amino-4-deoxy-L-arabinose transferase-like glycosyltransferase